MSADELRDRLRQFAVDRDWGQYHTPRNLALALVGEVGELAEILQWRTDDEVGELTNTPEGRALLGDELADVLIYLTRLADVLGIDLAEAAGRKLEMNALRYPANEVRGSAAKRSHP